MILSQRPFILENNARTLQSIFSLAKANPDRYDFKKMEIHAKGGCLTDTDLISNEWPIVDDPDDTACMPRE